MRGKSILAGVCGFAAALALWLLVLAVLLEACGTNSGLMLSMMKKHAPSQATGLAEEHYPGVVQMITRYLSGAREDFSYTVPDVYERPVALFSDREAAHMADCRQLFRLDRQVMLCCMAALAACFAAVLRLRARFRAAVKGWLAACLLCLTLLTAAVIWAMVDFDGLFVLFHRLSFANDLWLLDPRTDLLIRLMPLSFFVHYVTLIGLTWLAALLLMLGAGGLWLRRSFHKRGVRNEL